jgi:hypothetical protein
MKFIRRFNFKNFIAEGAFEYSHNIHLLGVNTLFYGKKFAVSINISPNPQAQVDVRERAFPKCFYGALKVSMPIGG